MKRRNAIARISLFVGGLAATVAGLEYYQLHQRPNFQMLDDKEALLDDLADTIIPPTDSPGAREAGVGALIIKMIHDCTERQSQNNFIRGLASLMAYSKVEYGRPFDACSPSEKIAILSHFEKAAHVLPGVLGKAQRMVIGDPFFTTLKKYTVLGYCTSKPGATMALRYDYIPGRYVGDTPLEPGQRAWATK